MGLETDNPVFSNTIPKRCEVFSSLSARIRRGFGEDFFEVRAPKMQLALRLEFLEIGTGRYSFHPTFFQNPTPRTSTVHSNVFLGTPTFLIKCRSHRALFVRSQHSILPIRQILVSHDSRARCLIPLPHSSPPPCSLHSDLGPGWPSLRPSVLFDSL